MPHRLSRWGFLALACGAVGLLALTERLGVRFGNAEVPLLVLVACASLLGGTWGGLLASVPCLAYAAWHFGNGNRNGGATWGYDAAAVQRLAVFAASAVAVSMVVGLVTARRRRSANRAVDSERAHGQTRLAETEGINRIVLNSLPAHVAVIDVDGRVLSTNKAWQRFQEDSGGSVVGGGVGSNYLEACRCATGNGADLARKVADAVEAVLRGRQDEQTIEYPCHAPHEQRWFLMSVTPLAVEGSPGVRGAVVTHLNITERKQSEEATRHRAAELAQLARALKKTNEDLDQFAYITSHDLRAPLRGIANLSNWIEEDMGDRFTAEAHAQMELLRGRVHRMEAMIDGILEYSRVGRVRVKPERFDVAALLADVLDLLDPPAGLRVEIEAGMPVVIGHKLGLHQVFMNLIGNAIKHHDKPAGRIVVACRDAGEMFEFALSDDGPGIDRRYHDKVFVIFQTLQPRDKVEGTGVGLSLVKKIVESEGGRIALESEPGKGATFRFTWPRHVSPADGRSGDARAARDGTPGPPETTEPDPEPAARPVESAEGR